MKKIDFKKATKHFIHAIKNIGSDADRDWRIFFLIFVIAFFLSVVAHAEIFISAIGGQDAKFASPATKTELINSKALAELLSKYDERASEFDKRVNEDLSLVDPSR
jgi:hypothetical protein